MERELWPRLYHLIMEMGETLRLIDVTFQPHIVMLATARMTPARCTTGGGSTGRTRQAIRKRLRCSRLLSVLPVGLAVPALLSIISKDSEHPAGSLESSAVTRF
jgi:hypothetical protein